LYIKCLQHCITHVNSQVVEFGEFGSRSYFTMSGLSSENKKKII